MDIKNAKGGEQVNRENQATMEGMGTLECLDHAAAVLMHLGSYLSSGNEKIRVTIERDPEKGVFTLKREVVP